ncbi:MAG: hypothetical protein GYB67_11705 [Chloroflexi bacterium]|nr:hypothetical protein [Chloroflexota bacterium]
MTRRHRPPSPSIRQQIEALRRERRLAPLRAQQTALARILDDLNAVGALEVVRDTRFSPRLCHGPRGIDGLTPVPWVAAVIWHRPAGYFGYKTLTLLGVWAYHAADGAEAPPVLSVGAKQLSYSAPFFDPEAYHKLIRRGYDVYYRDDGAPPAEAKRCAVLTYTPDERLALREALAAALLACAQ